MSLGKQMSFQGAEVSIRGVVGNTARRIGWGPNLGSLKIKQFRLSPETLGCSYKCFNMWVVLTRW